MTSFPILLVLFLVGLVLVDAKPSSRGGGGGINNAPSPSFYGGGGGGGPSTPTIHFYPSAHRFRPHSNNNNNDQNCFADSIENVTESHEENDTGLPTEIEVMMAKENLTANDTIWICEEHNSNSGEEENVLGSILVIVLLVGFGVGGYLWYRRERRRRRQLKEQQEVAYLQSQQQQQQQPAEQPAILTLPAASAVTY